MRTSEQTDKIDAAVGRVQAALPLVVRNKGVEVEGRTSKFASKYVTIAVLWETCRDLLKKEGVTIYQGGHFDEHGGGDRLITRLSHGGQWIESSVPIRAREGMQNYAGAFASARRIALAAIVGMFTSDDADERHGYDAERTQRGARRASAPVGIDEARMRIRECGHLADFERAVQLARGAFPQGDAATAIEREATAWLVDALSRVVAADELLAIRDTQSRVKCRGNDLRDAITTAEKRVKEGAP